MAYENITQEGLLTRMLSRISNTLDKREGSLIYNANAPASIELQELYIQLDMVLNETFVDTCSREFLLKRMKERGLNPRQAESAILKCVITPNTLPDDAVIGSRFSIDNLNYVCIPFNNDDRDGLAAGEFKLKCETAGSAGNYPIGNLTVVGNEIVGLQTAVIPNDAVLILGYDEEDTESCRKKYYDSLLTTTFGGNIADYKTKIKDFGAGAVKVFPNTDETGTSGKGGHVRVLMLDANFNIATSDFISEVQNKIDPTGDGSGLGVAPIGHIVHIETTTEEPIYVKVPAKLLSGFDFETLRPLVANEINNYLRVVKEKDWEERTNLTLIAQDLAIYIKGVSGFENLYTIKFLSSDGVTEYDQISISDNKIPSITEDNIRFVAED